MVGDDIDRLISYEYSFTASSVIHEEDEFEPVSRSRVSTLDHTETTVKTSKLRMLAGVAKASFSPSVMKKSQEGKFGKKASKLQRQVL